MIPSSIVTKFSGPPGTGKSTTLLNVVEQLLSSGVDPEHIVYTTFTRAGAYEARDRACERFKLTPNRLPYFKTLHSLCFGLLPSNEVMQIVDWAVIARTLGLFFSHRIVQEDGTTAQGSTKGDYLMSLWSIARVTQRTPQAAFIARDPSGFGSTITLQEFEHFIQTVDAYKKEFGKMDYTDMLERWLSDGNFIHADYIIIDEAQDLSLLQWAVVKKLCTHAKQVWVAGDDDQCIHEWNGAAPQSFIELRSDKYTVLPQSYRIPARVHRLAEGVIKRVTQRLPKTYHPRQDEGDVCRHADIESVDLSKGSWLLLARNLCFLEDYVAICRRRGLLYSLSAGGANETAKVVPAIKSWKALQKGDKISVGDAKLLYAFMSQRDRVTRGFKVQLQAANERDQITFPELVSKFGLVAPKDMAWPLALDMVPRDIAMYLQAVERSEGLHGTPRIRISTIHGAKGQEADHVVVRPDMTHRTYESWIKEPDPEHRVFYVAITRARQTLHLLPAVSEKAYPI